MAISVISVSLDSSEESVWTSAGRVILFGSIPTTIPNTTPIVTPPTTHVDTTLTPTMIHTVSSIVSPSLDYTLASLDYSPASDTESDISEDPSPDHIPPLPATSPFLSSTDDSSNSDTPDTPLSPTLVMILVLGQPIPYGRPYRYHPNRPIHMMTARKKVGTLLTHRLAVRHSVDYSSSDLFTTDDSSKTLLDSSLNDLSDSSSGHSSLDHSSPALPSKPYHPSFAGPSCKRSKSPTTYVPISSPIPRALSPARADLLSPPKMIRSSDFMTDLEDCSDESLDLYVPREISLRDDIVVRGSDEPYLEPDIDPES
nr:hypothetical protein [Tanacetum cinerariifolium]